MVMKAPVSGLNLASPPSYCPPLKRVLVNCPTRRTPFFNGGVRSLEGMGIQTSNSISRIPSKGGGSLGARMNLFDRLARVVKSYVNVILTSMEDPEKILDQAVLEMNDDLIKMRQATAQGMLIKWNFH